MPLRPCLEPGCGELIQRGPRCPAHTKQRDKEINRRGRKVYSTKAWRLLRRRVLFDEPLCRACRIAEGREILAREVDHINGDPTDNRRENLQPLCSPCHGAKTRKEQIRG